MVNRSRTAAGACNPLSRSVRGPPSISAPACREGRSPAARLTCARQSARDRAARTWPAGPEAPKARPSLRLQPSPRRTGPVVALDEGCAPIACRLVALPSPASRPSTPRRAFSQPRAGLDTARRRPDRPGSSCIGAQTGLRAAIDPPAYPESAPRRAPVARSARRRPVRSALSRLSVAHQRSVRCDSALNPALGAPCRRLSGSPPAHQAAHQRRAPTRQGPPAPPPRPPAQFPAGAGTRAHTYARACGVEISRKKIRVRETARRPRPGSRSVPWGGGREGDTGSRACAADSWEAGWCCGGTGGRQVHGRP